MPGQRASNKRRVTVPIEEALLSRIEKYAADHGINRVQAMKIMCAEFLKSKSNNDKKNKGDL
jgi:predicted DNA binding CopG/RHH family protein